MSDAMATTALPDASATSFGFNGVEFSTRVVPAAAAARGGDWCEAFAVAEAVIAISIGDVCGHGAEKFGAMVAIREEIRTAALKGMDPAQVLIQANLACLQNDHEMATAIFALLNTRQRSMTLANAGHPAPLMAGPFGTLFLDSVDPALPLGVDSGFNPALSVISLPAATLFVFYTDGVIESTRDTVQGAARLRIAANRAAEMPGVPTATAIGALMQLTASNFDDVAILTARTPGKRLMRNRYLNGGRRRGVLGVLPGPLSEQ